MESHHVMSVDPSTIHHIISFRATKGKREKSTTQKNAEQNSNFVEKGEWKIVENVRERERETSAMPREEKECGKGKKRYATDGSKELPGRRGEPYLTIG